MHRLRLALTRFAAWLSAYRKPFLVLGGLFVVVSMVVSIPHEAYAIDAFSTAASHLVSLLAMLLDYLTQAVGKLILVLIEAILVPILNYDGFATSRIIGLGWSLVRDTVNMFVVVILLVIAVLTIVGSPRANWQQQIPRLFIYVIAVNFSRTICGFLLDIGNVIMFQFVNAILDVGAGNFAQLLKINIAGSYSSYFDAALQPAQQLGAAYLQLALLLAVLAVIVLMTLVFLYRIVVLWVLIILSPAAFFMGGIKDIVGQAGSAYGDWWKKFSSAIILGPLLTFFLWLALAAASSGDIVTSENFPVGDETSNVGLVLKLFDMSQITGLLLGLVLLVVGMQQASSAAGALGGFAGKLINEGMGKRIIGGALKWPVTGARLGYRAGRPVAEEAFRQADRRVANMLGRPGEGLTGLVGGDFVELGRRVRNIPVVGGVGRVVSYAGDKMLGLSSAQVHEAQANAKKRVGAWSNERMLAELRTAADMGTGSPLLSNQDDAEAAFTRLVTTRSLSHRVEEQLPGQVNDIMREAINEVNEHRDHLLTDDTQRNAFNATQSRFADLIGPRIAEFIDSTDFNPRLLREQALQNADVRAALQEKVVRTTNDGRQINAWDEMLRGAYGVDLRDAAFGSTQPTLVTDDTHGGGPIPVGAGVPGGPAAPLRDPGHTFTVDEIRANITAGNIQVDTLDAVDFTGLSGPNLSRALLDEGINPGDAVRLHNPGAHDAFAAQAFTVVNALPPEQRAQIDVYNINNPHAARGAGDPATILVDPTTGVGLDQNRVARAVQVDPAIIDELGGIIAGGGPDADDTRQTIVETVQQQPAMLRTLVDRFNAAATPAEQAHILNAVQGAIDAVVDEARVVVAHMPPGDERARRAELGRNNRELLNAYNRVHEAARFMRMPRPDLG